MTAGGEESRKAVGVARLQARSQFSHSAASASEGIRQSPRGERLTVPTFGPSGTLARARGHHRAVLLHDGRVLIVGGPAEAELWDPATQMFGPAGTAYVRTSVWPT